MALDRIRPDILAVPQILAAAVRLQAQKPTLHQVPKCVDTDRTDLQIAVIVPSSPLSVLPARPLLVLALCLQSLGLSSEEFRCQRAAQIIIGDLYLNQSDMSKSAWLHARLPDELVTELQCDSSCGLRLTRGALNKVRLAGLFRTVCDFLGVQGGVRNYGKFFRVSYEKIGPRCPF